MYFSWHQAHKSSTTCLTLHDLSAAFDTINQTILLERLSSWFCITSTGLSWVKSYLLEIVLHTSVSIARDHLFINYSMVFLKVRRLSSLTTLYTQLSDYSSTNVTLSSVD